MQGVLAASMGPEASRPRDGGEPARAIDRAGTLEEALETAAGPGFASFLEVTREHLGRAIRGTGFEKASAEQMFEPHIADAHQRRQAAMKEDFRAASVDAANDRYADRVEAKKRQGGIESVPRAGQGQDAGSSAGASAKDDPGTVRGGARAGQEADGSAPRLKPDSRSAKDVGGAFDGHRTRTEGRSAQPAASAQVGSVGQASPNAGAASVTPNGTANTAREGSLAQQLGRVLSVTRSGAAESARAVEAPTASGQAGNESTASKSPAPSQGATGGRQAEANEAGRTRTSEPSRFEELIRSIRTQTGSKQSTARIQLEPPELGRMRVNVSLHEDRLHVEVRTETAEASRIMNARAAELKAALASQGLVIEQFEVSHNGSELPEFGPGDGRFTDSARQPFDAGARHDREHAFRFGDEAEPWDLWSDDAVRLGFGRGLLDVKA